MDYKYYACPPIEGTHIAWIVDGCRVPLTFPLKFTPGSKLTVAFGYKPSRVNALIQTTVDGQVAYYNQPATEEKPCSSSS